MSRGSPPGGFETRPATVSRKPDEGFKQGRGDVSRCHLDLAVRIRCFAEDLEEQGCAELIQRKLQGSRG